MPAIPFMLIKPLLEKYIPYLIGGILVYALAIAGIVYQLDGWHVFFSILALTVFVFLLAVYMVYREIKAQMRQMQEMMQGLQNMFMGAGNGEGNQGGGGIDLSALMGAMGAMGAVGGGMASTMAIASSVDANGDKVVLETASLTAPDGTTLNAEAVFAEDHDGHKVAAMHVDGAPTVFLEQNAEGNMIDPEISFEDVMNEMKNNPDVQAMMTKMMGHGLEGDGGGDLFMDIANLVKGNTSGDELVDFQKSMSNIEALSNITQDVQDVEVKEMKK